MKSKVILLVGPPLSGKDTYLNSIGQTDFQLISRDDILMSLHTDKNYTEAFRKVDQKLVDKILNQQITDAIKQKRSVVINMTNLTLKSRNRHLCKFPDSQYEKIAVVFPKLSMEEYEYRNNKRKKETNKFIPVEVIKDMVDKWEEVTKEEGFETIIKIK